MRRCGGKACSTSWSGRRSKPLPAEPYVDAEWKQCKLGLDYHVEVEKRYYSAPHTLLREKLWVRTTAHAIELFHSGNRVAAHVRSSSNRKYTTIAEHMPSCHRRYTAGSPDQQVAGFRDPAAGGELLEQRLVELAQRAVVDFASPRLKARLVP